MPMGWVAPELLFSYRGVLIYATYDDDNADSVTNDYHYCACEAATEDEWFDVRDLPGISLDSAEVLTAAETRDWLAETADKPWTLFEEHRLQIEFAIDSGEFFKLVPKAHISMESSDG